MMKIRRVTRTVIIITNINIQLGIPWIFMHSLSLHQSHWIMRILRMRKRLSTLKFCSSRNVLRQELNLFSMLEKTSQEIRLTTNLLEWPKV